MIFIPVDIKKVSSSLIYRCTNKYKFEQCYDNLIVDANFQLHLRNFSGESILATGAINKQQQYPNANHVIGFKVDCHLVVDVNKKEYDSWAIEVAKEDTDPQGHQLSFEAD